MTKQGEIRKGLIKFFTPPNRVRSSGQDYFNENIGKVVDKLLSYLHSQGVVVKVERELRKCDYTKNFMTQKCAYELAQQEMLKAGYVAVEPLTSNTDMLK